MVQWLRLSAPNTGCPGSIPGLGTRSCMPQLEILCATKKTWLSQINKLKKKCGGKYCIIFDLGLN